MKTISKPLRELAGINITPGKYIRGSVPCAYLADSSTVSIPLSILTGEHAGPNILDQCRHARHRNDGYRGHSAAVAGSANSRRIASQYRRGAHPQSSCLPGATDEYAARWI